MLRVPGQWAVSVWGALPVLTCALKQGGGPRRVTGPELEAGTEPGSGPDPEARPDPEPQPQRESTVTGPELETGTEPGTETEVNATPCFDNPLRHHSSSVQRVLDMFWTRGPESFTEIAELTVEMRCKDPWLSAMLRECRTGSLQWEMYCFFHGLATEHPGSWMPETRRPSCGNRRCLDLAEGTWAEMRRQG